MTNIKMYNLKLLTKFKAFNAACGNEKSPSALNVPE